MSTGDNSLLVSSASRAVRNSNRMQRLKLIMDIVSCRMSLPICRSQVSPWSPEANFACLTASLAQTIR